MTPERDLLEQLQQLLADADLDAEDVVERAWHDARAEVEGTLRRLMSHELLQRCLRTLEAGHDPREPGSVPSPEPATGDVSGPASDPAAKPPAASTRQADPPQADSLQADSLQADTRLPGEVLTYVFGITRAGVDRAPDPADLARLPGGGALHTVTADDLQALVCNVDPATFEILRRPGPEGLDTLAAAAHAHDEALAALARATTVLPLRLGTVLGDDEEVRAMLVGHADGLRAELARLAGHAEWAVTVHLIDEPDDGDDDARAARSGSDYLRRRGDALARRETRSERRDLLATELHERLTACAAAADVVAARPVEDVAPPLLHGVYLLADTEVERFRELVGRLREEHPRTVIEYSGPWPPYHFARVELTPPQDVGP